MALTDKLSAIANAIREKTGKTDSLTLEQMPSEIANISGGGELTPACQVKVVTVDTEKVLYYNHEPLLALPADAAAYPYGVIVQNIAGVRRLWLCDSKLYCKVNEDGNMILQVPSNNIYYEADSCWHPKGAYTNDWSYSVDGSGSNWSIWWSNFDIPLGSPDGTEIFWHRSEPLAQQPADATHFYYNGVRLPAIPADVLATHPYAWIRNNTRTGYYDLLLSTTAWYLKNENTIAHDDDPLTQWYQVKISEAESSDEWVFSSEYDSATWGNESDRRIMWSNQNLPNGAVDAAEIYFYGNPAVPAS